MNVSWRWLQDLAPSMELDVEGAVERLALRGAPVESSAYLGEDLGDIVVARVEAAVPHPGADRLTLCQVNPGSSESLSVVCGAPNVKPGGIYPFAPVGSTLPGGFAIGKRKIRGEVSMGMLCSPRELALGTDHSGILELPSELEPGTRLVDALSLDDWRLEVEVTANRGDLLSHLGIARELAPEGEGGLHLPPIPGAPPVELTLAMDPEAARTPAATVRIEDPDLCYRYLGAVVRGVKVGPSPGWLQARLRAVGSRPINNVVDATNYVLLELGQPLHAFDLGRLAESTIVVRRPRAQEKSFRTLDGEERRLTPEMLMICDAQQPVAIGGVMGGLDSEVTTETTDVLLECALFDPRSIRGTRRALGLSTDASYRFERGVDPEGMVAATRRALELILATAGGTLEPEVADCRPRPWEPFSISLRLSRVERVLGVPFTPEAVRSLLEPLGFAVTDADRGAEAPELEVSVPGFRSLDVTREIDLIEEIARAHGFDAFPEALGAYRPGTVPDHPLFRLEDDLRRTLAERGLYESQSPAFVPATEGDVRIDNPVSLEESFLRKDLIPSLIRRVQYNWARGLGDVRLFEVGTSFEAASEGGPPGEEPRLAVVLTGSRTPPHWTGPEEPFDLWDLRGVLEEVVAQVGLDARLEGGAPGGRGLVMSEGFSVVRGDGASLGWGGLVDPEAVDAPPWASPLWAFELRLPSEPSLRQARRFRPLPPFPGVERDLALIVPDGVPARSVSEAIRASGGPHLRGVEVFDLYRGASIPQGTRSLAYRLRFQSPERTLTDEEVDEAVQTVTRRLGEELHVQVRR